MTQKQPDPKVRLTKDLSLRVSVAALVRVLFTNPEDGIEMLVLERTATLTNSKRRAAIVKVKPFGGGLRILKPMKLKKLIGDFQYDSERSLEEGDFRIHIRPEQWENVKKICQEHLTLQNQGIIETSPVRELSEEMHDSLQIQLNPEDFTLSTGMLLIEERMTATENIHAPGTPTKRVYYLFEARLKNSHIMEMILENSLLYSDQDLERIAYKDAQQGGKGRANAVITMPLDHLVAFYRSVSVEKRESALSYAGHLLDGNVSAILEL
jgi:hypothetical protein